MMKTCCDYTENTPGVLERSESWRLVLESSGQVFPDLDLDGEEVGGTLDWPGLPEGPRV